MKNHLLRPFAARCLTFGLTFTLAAASFSPAQVSEKKQAKITPDLTLDALMLGNARFASGNPRAQAVTARRAAAASAQFPMAVILSCLDSRVPVEQVFDQGIGDIFVGRVAGNVSDNDQLGSMEFATKLAGASLVMVLGHTACGAVAGACDNAKLGHLTGVLAKIRPAVKAVQDVPAAQRVSSNPKFVDKVAAENVRLTTAKIRKNSPILAALEKSGDIKIVGGMYDLKTGRVSLIK